MEKFTPLATNFTLPPGLTGWTNSTSALVLPLVDLPVVLHENSGYLPYESSEDSSNQPHGPKGSPFTPSTLRVPR